MKRFGIVLRDWWRGWTNDDLASALRKTEKGEVVLMSPAEMKAWLAFRRNRCRCRSALTVSKGKTMTLREFIDSLEDLASDIPEGDQIEVVAIDHESREPYTPVISVGVDRDGVRRLSVA